MDFTHNVPFVQKLREDPEFQKLDYESQRAIATEATRAFFQQDEEFMQQDPKFRLRLIQQATSDFTPAFSDPTMAERAEAAKRHVEESGVPGDISGDAAMIGLVKGNLVARALQGVLLDEEQKELMSNSESDKLFKYLGLSGVERTGELYGMGTDIAASIVLGNYTGGLTRSALATKALTSQRGTLAHFWASQLAPAATEAATEGLYRAGMTYVGDEEKRRFGEYASIFGSEAALDFVASRGIAALGTLGRSLGRTFGKGYHGTLAQEIGERGVDDAIEGALKRPATGTAEELGRKQEAWNWQRDQLQRISRETPLSELRLDPDSQLIEGAANSGHVIRRYDNGSWGIWKYSDTTNKPRAVARTTDEAYEKIGNSIIEDIGDQPGALENLVKNGRPEGDFVRIAQRRAVARQTLGEGVIDTARRDELVKQGAVRGRFVDGKFELDELGEQVALPGRFANMRAMDGALGMVERSGGKLDLDLALARKGYDSYLDETGKLHLVHGKRQIGTVMEGAKTAGKPIAKVTAEQQQRANVRQIADSVRDAVRGGQGDELEKSIRAITGDALNVTVRDADDASKLTQVRLTDEGLEVASGRGARTASEQRRLENELVTNLRRSGKVDPKRLDKVQSALEGTEATGKFSVPFLSKSAKDGLVEHMARTLGATRVGKGQYELAGELLEGSSDELAYKLLLRSYDFPEAQRVVREQLGASLEKLDDGFQVKFGNKTYKDESIAGALERSGFVPTSASSRFMPRLALLDSDMPYVEWTGEVVSGSPTRVRRALTALTNQPQRARSVRLRSGKVQVELPEWGIKQVVNASDAGKFVEGEFKKIDNIRDVMSGKQVDVFVEDGAVKFVTPEGEILTGRTEAEIQRIMKKIPDPPDAPALLGDELEEVMQQLQDGLGEQFPPHVKPTATELNRKSFRLFTNIAMQTENTDFALERLFKDAGVPELQVAYRHVENGRRFSDAEFRTWNEILDQMFKGMDIDARRRVFHLRNKTTAGNMRSLGFALGEVGDAERQAVQRLETVLDGFARKYGIRQELLDNYISHVRKVYIEAPEKLKNSWSRETPKDLLDYAYRGSEVPEQLKFWAETMRLENFVDFLVDTDAKSVMHKYMQRAIFMANVRESYKVFHDLANKNAPKLGANGLDRVNMYMQELAGTNYRRGEEVFKRLMGDIAKRLTVTPKRIRRVAQKQARRLGGEMTEIDLQRVEAQLTGKAEKAGRDALSTFYGLTYFANLAMKPWMAIRNSQQVWTTLAGRFSNKEVFDAIRKLNNNAAGISEELRRIGVINDRPPLVTDVEFVGKLQKATAIGMRSFQNSDDYTRAIAYLTATDALDTAVRGGFVELGPEAFAKKSGTEFINPTERAVIYDLVRRGDVATAKRLFGTHTSEATMFGYRTSQAPAMFRHSGLMKAGGQYGTYSTGYRTNILRALEHATPGGKVKFMITLLSNSTALASGAAALGVRYQDFVPGLPGLFGGGPNFETAVNILYSFDTGYKGVKAKSELRRSLDPLAFGQVRLLRNALDQADAGNALGAVAALGGVPLLD